MAVAAKDVDWQHNKFYAAIDAINYAGYYVYFVEGEDKWAAISINNTIAGYVWKRFPMVLITHAEFEVVKSALRSHHYIIFITAHKLSEAGFSIDYDKVKDYFVQGFDSKNFSAEDLWFNSL